MKRIGIWIDKKKAHLVRLDEGQEVLETIYSDLDFFNPSGGSRTKSAKWGPQDVVQDSKYLEKEKHQLKKYFNNLVDAIGGDVDAIAIFGPADTNEKLRKELNNSHKDIATKLKTVIKTDSMTENQVRAMVRDYFRDED